MELAKVVIEDGILKFKVEDAQQILNNKSAFLKLLEVASNYINKNFNGGIQFDKSEIY